MKLKEIAEIRKGVSISSQLLVSTPKQEGKYVEVLTTNSIVQNTGHYIFQKELRKLPDYSNRTILVYGDYIVYKDGEYKLLRYETPNGYTVAGNDLIILRQDYGILKEYFFLEKNKNFFLKELKKIEAEKGEIDIQNISEIEINVNDILELNNANIAEQIGIRKPVDIIKHPISIIQKPLPADKLIKRIDNNELLLDTDFQRRPDLWDFETKSRLIESMLIGLAIPAFYFDGSNDDEWVVIDGLQRLSALNGFLKGKFSLSGLDYLSDLEDKSFQELDRKQQRKIEEYEVIVYIIGGTTLPSVKYKIFKTINTSALKLTSQEIRHAINPGPSAMLLKKIANMDWFQKGLIIPPAEGDRMYDREVALRFIAFQHTNYREYSPNMVDFLDTMMLNISDEIPIHYQERLISELENIFEIVFETLGDKAFSRSLFDSSKVFPHNNIIFELLTYGISKIPKERRNELKKPGLRFKEVIVEHFKNKPDRFWDSDYAYTKENLIKRFEEIEILFMPFV